MTRRPRGFTLVELMIAMLLGLIIIGGATSLIVANRQSYRTNEALSQVQESARTAFELLARDVREAGISGCDSNGRMANVLSPPVSGGLYWWQTWFGIAGYESAEVNPAVPTSSATAERVAGTDSVILQGILGTGLTIENHDPVSANFKINSTTTDFVVDDILIVCDFDHAVMLQVTSYNSSNVTVVHNTGDGVSVPGNCSKGLGYPTVCTTNGNTYIFGPNSQIARMSAVAWYIGNNNRAAEGGRSLYRRRLGRGAAVQTEEVVAGVTNLQLTYREEGVDEFRTADSIGNWSNVSAMMIELTVQSADRRVTTDSSVNAGRIERRFTNIVTLRNRVP
jgi:type IV pilus assembly protein PilW